jgi:uncharacterized caspase-like protein
LQLLGFKLVGNEAQLDLDKARLDGVVQSFGQMLHGADVGLFYYAGHGVQVRGSNYLVPVGANPTREADVDFQMLDTNLVLRQMESAGTKLNLIILDACRNNPFGARGVRATSGGLAQMQAPQGTLISFATQPGNVSADGTDGNSPYTKALAQTLRQPGLNIFQTFNQVGLAVMRATGNVQQPWLATSPINGDFYFVTRPLPGAPDEPSLLRPLLENVETGDYAVQVSSQRSEADAQSAFRSLQTQFPTQLGGRKAIVRRADLGTKGVYFRALIGPFASQEEAVGFCSSLRAAGGTCDVRRTSAAR